MKQGSSLHWDGPTGTVYLVDAKGTKIDLPGIASLEPIHNRDQLKSWLLTAKAGQEEEALISARTLARFVAPDSTLQAKFVIEENEPEYSGWRLL